MYNEDLDKRRDVDEYFQFPITAMREIKLLKLLNHENILRLCDMAVEHPSRQGRSLHDEVYPPTYD